MCSLPNFQALKLEELSQKRTFAKKKIRKKENKFKRGKFK